MSFQHALEDLQRDVAILLGRMQQIETNTSKRLHEMEIKIDIAKRKQKEGRSKVRRTLDPENYRVDVIRLEILRMYEETGNKFFVTRDLLKRVKKLGIASISTYISSMQRNRELTSLSYGVYEMTEFFLNVYGSSERAMGDNADYANNGDDDEV